MQIYTSMKTPPCKGCESREVGCHGRCEKYKAFRKQHDAIKEKMCAERNARDYFIEHQAKAKQKRRK